MVQSDSGSSPTMIEQMYDTNIKGKPLTYIGKRKKKEEIMVEYLDYGFLDECDDADKIRGVIELLKSGKEGLYPHLERHAEKRLVMVLPEKEAKKIILMNTEASEAEVSTELANLSDWMKNIGKQDSSLKMTEGSNNAMERDMPPVRGQKAPPKKKQPVRETPSNAPQITEGSQPTGIEGSAAKHTHASQYFRAWEKYDADGEVEKIEQMEEEEAERAKQAALDHADAAKRRAKRADEELRKLLGDVDFGSLSPAERSFCAVREKQKGNECFKAGEVKEALVFYSKSIALDSTSSVVYANRALAHLREKNFEQAEEDCTMALELDPTYLKALSRRGMTRHRRGKYRLAIEDFEKALELDSSNVELGKLLKKSKEKWAETEGDSASGSFRRVMIEDVDDDSDSDSDSDETESEEEEEEEEDVPIRTASKGISIRGSFTACSSFQGAKSGYVFKKGDEGVGYYREGGADEESEDDEEDVPIKTNSTRIAIVEDDDDDDDSEDDEEDVPIKTSNSTRIAIVEDDDDEESEEDEEDVPIKTSSSTRIAIVEDDDDESEDDEEDVPVKTSSSTRIAIVEDDDDEEDDEEDVPIKTSSTRIAIVEDDDSEDEEDVPVKTSSTRIAITEDDDDEDDDEEDVPIKTSSTRIAITEDDDDSEDDEEDVPVKTSTTQPSVAAAPPAPPAAASAPPKIKTVPAPATSTSTSTSPSSSNSSSSSSSSSPVKRTSPKKSPKKDPVAVAARAKAKAKAKGGAGKVPPQPKTGYEFERVWRSLKSDRPLFCRYLQLIKPSSYKKLFKQGIESELASSIVQVVSELMVEADPVHALATLNALPKINRFNTVLMFFGSTEKTAIAGALDVLEGAAGVDAAKLAKARATYGA